MKKVIKQKLMPEEEQKKGGRYSKLVATPAMFGDSSMADYDVAKEHFKQLQPGLA